MYRAKQSLYIFYSNYQILVTCLTNKINNNLFSNIILRTTILNNTDWIIYDPIMGQIRPHVTNKIKIKLISLNEFMVAAPPPNTQKNLLSSRCYEIERLGFLFLS